jgi:hypothetical protein
VFVALYRRGGPEFPISKLRLADSLPIPQSDAVLKMVKKEKAAKSKELKRSRKRIMPSQKSWRMQKNRRMSNGSKRPGHGMKLES